jgi:hypothetical protein
MRIKFLLTVLLVSACVGVSGQQGAPDEPEYTKDGELVRPDYREWIFLTAGLGMTYGVVQEGAPVSQRFDNVFVTPKAYRTFVQTGTWPDKTMFILEVRSATSKGSINKGGHYQEDVVGVEAHVKDSARFPEKWGFFNLGASGAAGKPLPATSTCQTCHAKHGAVDQTFVQFYPTLIPIAKAKGTYHEGEQ